MTQDQDLTDVRERAQNGDAPAMYEFAMALYEEDPRGNLEESAYWLMRSAKAGYPFGQYMVGKWYARGVYTRANPNEASRWISRATHSPEVVELVKEEAAAGDGDALCTLGTLHFNGEYVVQNREKAFECYKRSAEQEVPRAMYNLARNYECGYGCEVDLVLAYYWYDRGAHRGVSLAAERLGAWYLFGHHDFEIDYRKAHLYFRMAAAFGEPGGLRYMQVHGLTPERVN